MILADIQLLHQRCQDHVAQHNQRQIGEVDRRQRAQPQRRGEGGRDGHSGECVHIPSVRDGVFREYGRWRGDSPDRCAAGGDGAGESAAIAVGLEGKSGCVSQNKRVKGHQKNAS